jgi:hypothetical protein
LNRFAISTQFFAIVFSRISFAFRKLLRAY